MVRLCFFRLCQTKEIGLLPDVSLIPRGVLPLQTTLEFNPCPLSTATSYLQALCLAEGTQVARGDLTHLLQEQSGDLRRALQHLQVCFSHANAEQPLLPAEPASQQSKVLPSNPGSSPLPWPDQASSPDASSLVPEVVTSPIVGPLHSHPGSSLLELPEQASSPPPIATVGVDAGSYDEVHTLRLLERHHDVCSFADAWLERNSVPILSVSLACSMDEVSADMA